MTAPCPPPPDIATPPEAPVPAPLRVEPGTWHSAEPRWPRWATGAVLVALVLAGLAIFAARSDVGPLQTPVGAVEVIPNILASPVFIVVFTLAAAALAWFTRLFTRGGQGLIVATCIVSAPGALWPSLSVANQVTALAASMSSLLVVAAVIGVIYLWLRRRLR